MLSPFIPGTESLDQSGKNLVQIEPKMGVERWALAFVGGKDTGNEPKSCFNCPFMYVNQKRCQIHGADIVIDIVTKSGQQYTPVCVYQTGGTPRAIEDNQVIYNATILGAKKAELTGLEWAKGTGTNCGGYAGGAECEYFVVTDGKGVDGICKLMDSKDRAVDWDDCCDGHDGDHISWQEAQELLRGSL